MKNGLPLLACAMLAACGDLSNDDLLFLAAVPSRAEVALEVAEGAPAGALSAAQLGVGPMYREEATAEAEWINGTVGRLLDFVTTLGQSSPPSERSEDKRVWGPMRNVGGEGITVRLQIERQHLAGGSPRYQFCLHMGKDGAATAGDVSCASGKAGGLYSIMSGTYVPLAKDGSRAGSGVILIDFEASESVGASATGQGGLFKLEYDFTGGGESKALRLVWSDFTSFGSAPQTLDYTYDRAAEGLVRFSFQALADVIGGDAVERQAVEACWRPSGAGRARVQIRGGDVPRGGAASAAECWDAVQAGTYYYLYAGPGSPQNVEQGDASSCPDC